MTKAYYYWLIKYTQFFFFLLKRGIKTTIFEGSNKVKYIYEKSFFFYSIIIMDYIFYDIIDNYQVVKMLVTLSYYLNDKPFQSKYSFKTTNYHKNIKYLTHTSHNKIPIHNCSITKQIHHRICANCKHNLK